MLNKHPQQLANTGCELAIEAQAKVKEWESNPGDGLPGTTGDTYADSHSYSSTRFI
jgi:hypothetical protein